MAWNWGVDALRDYALPSLLQRDNIPWLLQNDFEVTFNVFTLPNDADRLREMLQDAFGRVTFSSNAPSKALTVNVLPTDHDPSDTLGVKRLAFLAQCQLATEAGAPILITGSDAFYGNGSIRNICLYARKPGVATGVLSTRVKRDPFLRLLQEYQRTFPGRPVSNAKLVDMALRTQIEAAELSDVDRDRNTSFTTGSSFRRLSDDIHVGIYHLPSPVMFWPEKTDTWFFDYWCKGYYQSLDHIWPAKLVAQRRWRVLASSDIFFLAELTPEEEEVAKHRYQPEDHRLFNEAFAMELPHTVHSEMVVATLRREWYLAP